MKGQSLKIILLSAVLCLGPVTSFCQETLTKPSKPENQTETPNSSTTTKKQQSTTQKKEQQQSSNEETTSMPTQSTQQVQIASPPANGYINGHEYVDLGLSVKWATCNIGASLPTAYGDYYAWGETTTKSTYTSANSSTYEKYRGDIAGNSDYDAARANWGGTWRLPTKKEMEELLDNCTVGWTSRDGVNGYLFTSKKNDNSIFFPLAGDCYESKLHSTGETGYYWSSTPDECLNSHAYILWFYNGKCSNTNFRRCYGISVRPVTK